MTFISGFNFKNRYKVGKNDISFISLSFVKYEEYSRSKNGEHSLVIKCSPIVDPYLSRKDIDKEYAAALVDSSTKCIPIIYLHRHKHNSDEFDYEFYDRSYGYMARYRGNWFFVSRKTIQKHEFSRGDIDAPFVISTDNRCGPEISSVCNMMMKEMFNNEL